MRDFGLIPTCFWKDERIQNLKVPTRLVGIYLYAGPHTNVIGCFRLPLSYISEDLRIPKRILTKAIEDLTAISFLRFDEASKYFAITNFLSTRAKRWLSNQNNFIAATRELDQIPESVPFKEEIRLQLIEIKGGASNGDTNRVLTPMERRTIYSKEEGDGEHHRENNEDNHRNAPSAWSSLRAAPTRDSSIFSGFVPLPRTFCFPLKNGGELEVDSEVMDRWQSRYPSIVVPRRLQHHLEWFRNNPHKRMNQKGTETALLRMLAEDNEQASTQG
jgi:hypothetical protein